MSNGKTVIFAGGGNGMSVDGAKATGGLFRCIAGESRWEQLNAGLPDNAEIRVILPHPTQAKVVFVGAQDGPYHSDDGGDHWRRLNFPDRAVVWAITIHPTRPNVMYAGAAPIALYRSDDGGENWRRLENAVSPMHCERAGFDSRVLRITVDPNRPDDVYAALEVSGVLRSSDGGESWADISGHLITLANENPHLHSNVGGRHCGHLEGILDSHATAISPALPDTVFLGQRMGLFRSDDRGETWVDTEIGRFSPLTYCHDVIVSAHDPRVLYTCLSPAAFSHDGSLYRSDDLGTNWKRIDHGVASKTTLMVVSEHARDPARIYCATRGGQVFGTEDAGASWREYRLPAGVEDIFAVACA